MNHILCFGEALIDFLAVPGDDPALPPSFVQYAGGAPANAAVAIARLGGNVRFVGMLGNDMFGDFLDRSLVQAGVDVRHARRTSQARTALAFVSLDEHGERSFSFYRPPSADLLFKEDDFDAEAFHGAAAFHACSNSLTDPGIAQATLAGMRMARRAGALVSVDLNLRPSLWPTDADPLPVVRRALAEADLIKLSAEELAFLCRDGHSQDAVVSELLQSARVVVVTDGAQPLRWFGRGVQGELPVFSVHAVDTTAAGDAFIGGLLSRIQAMGVRAESLGGLVADVDAFSGVLRFAAACGAIAVTRFGAFASLPSQSEAEAMVSERAPC